MPEQITKYPDVTIDVLKGAGAVCGEGAPQKILTRCPAARFCSLPTGEVCVYGISEIPKMTQITTQELLQVISPGIQPRGVFSPAVSGIEVTAAVTLFLAGLALGRYWRKVKSGGL
jgi:hypothetical protein